MRRTAAGCLGLLLASVCAPLVGIAQEGHPGVLTLQIFDFNSGAPLPGVLATIPELELSALSDRTGYLHIVEIPLGRYRLVLSRPGYAGVEALLDFTMESAWAEGEVVLVPELAGVDVVVPRIRSLRLLETGFYQRQRSGLGRYFSRDDAVVQNAFVLSDVLRRVPGIRVAPSGVTSGSGFGGFQPEHPSLTRRYRSCIAAVYLDGVEWKGTLDQIPLSWVEGVEVYNRASFAPPPYGSGSFCGVILVWTR